MMHGTQILEIEHMQVQVSDLERTLLDPLDYP